MESSSTNKQVLPATFELLKEIDERGDFYLVTALTNAVLSFGSQADADFCLEQFLQAPEREYSANLLKIIGRWGDSSHAAILFNFSIENDRLQENFPEEVLENLGQLKLEKAKQVLASHSLNSDDYYLNKSAVLGLLHLECDDLQEEIRGRFTEILGQNTFPEYLPALVCKLPDSGEWLEKFYNWGATTCSTDCNAGILLGFSLCGEQGKSFFKKALFDPNWEAFYNAAPVIVGGMQRLEISFEELLQEADEVKNEKDLQYYMLVINSLLEVKLKSYDAKGESFESLYRDIFIPEIFQTLAERAGQQEDAEKVRELLILRMKEEILLRSRVS